MTTAIAILAVIVGLVIFRLIWGEDDDFDTYADYCREQEEDHDRR